MDSGSKINIAKQIWFLFKKTDAYAALSRQKLMVKLFILVTTLKEVFLDR